MLLMSCSGTEAVIARTRSMGFELLLFEREVNATEQSVALPFYGVNDGD